MRNLISIIGAFNYKKIFKIIVRLITMIFISLFFSAILFYSTPLFLSKILPYAPPPVSKNPYLIPIGFWGVTSDRPWWENGFPFQYEDYNVYRTTGIHYINNIILVIDLLIYFIFTFTLIFIMYFKNQKVFRIYKIISLIFIILIFFFIIINFDQITDRLVPYYP